MEKTEIRLGLPVLAFLFPLGLNYPVLTNGCFLVVPLNLSPSPNDVRK